MSQMYSVRDKIEIHPTYDLKAHKKLNFCNIPMITSSFLRKRRAVKVKRKKEAFNGGFSLKNSDCSERNEISLT